MKKYLSKKLLITGVSLLVLGLIFILISVLIGASVGANGVLHELFFLIPLGWLLILIGGLVLIAAAFIALRKQDKAVNLAIRQKEEKEKQDKNSEK